MKRSWLGLVVSGVSMMGALVIVSPAALASTDQSSQSTSSSTGVTSTGVTSETMNSTAPSSVAIQPMATYPPSSYWNISALGDYKGAFQDVSNGGGGIYTNYYFSPNAAGELTLDSSITGNQGSPSQNYNLYIWDERTNTLISGQTITIGTYDHTFSGLNPNDFYYFEWKANGYNQLIDGNFTVGY